MTHDDYKGNELAIGLEDEEPPTVKADKRILITGIDRKGVGRSWSMMPGPKVRELLEKICNTYRYEVTARCNGVVVGQVWKNDGRWAWTCEAWALGEEAGK